MINFLQDAFFIVFRNKVFIIIMAIYVMSRNNIGPYGMIMLIFPLFYVLLDFLFPDNITIKKKEVYLSHQSFIHSQTAFF